MNEIIHLIKGYLGYGVHLWIKDGFAIRESILEEWIEMYGFINTSEYLKNNKIKLKLKLIEDLTDE